jgi:hypothetical protein
MPQKIEEAEPAGARPMSDDRAASGRSSVRAQAQGAAMMDESAVLANFDAMAIANEVAALEAEAQSELADAKGAFASRSEKIAAILWNVKQHHPEHLDAICERANIGLSRRKELLQVGSGRKTIKQSRQATAARQAKFKAKKKAKAAEPPTSEAVTKAPVTASEAGKPTLDPRAWVMSTPQEREAFVKAVGRRDLEDAFNAIEPGYALTRGSLQQTWNAATPPERLAFAIEYHDMIKNLGSRNGESV